MVRSHGEPGSGPVQTSNNLTESDVGNYHTGSGKAKWLLYVSHALSTWGSRSWDFAVGLVILALYQSSLREVSVYGLATALGAVLFGPSVGRYIDRTPRFRAVAVFYFVQNVGMAFAAVTSLVLLWHGPNTVKGPMAVVLLASVVFWGVLGTVGYMGSTVSVEKEWTVALCGDDEEQLAKMNSTLRTIDLLCMILAPVLTGFLMTYCGMRTAVIEIAGFNLLAWVPEVLFAKYAQNTAPRLQVQKFETKGSPPLEGGDGDALDEPLLQNSKGKKVFGKWQMVQAVKVYYQQSCILSMLSIALLHLTVLTLGIVMTSYLKSKGFTEAQLSLYRGASALSGVLGARSFPFLVRKLGLPATGLVTGSMQFIPLAVGVIPLVVRAVMGLSEAPSATVNLLVWGLVLSRFGLYTYDLTVSQTMQLKVDSTKLGTVTGVQKMHENFITMVMYGMVVIVNDLKDFVWLMAGSLCVVGTAVGLHIMYMCQLRASADTA